MDTYKIRLPQTLAGTEELVARRSADNEVLGEIDTPDAVKPANEGLSSCLVDTRQYGTDKEWTETLLVQR